MKSGINVDIYEKEEIIGGHTYTLDINHDKSNNVIKTSHQIISKEIKGKTSIDLGFQVYNKYTYPNILGIQIYWVFSEN